MDFYPNSLQHLLAEMERIDLLIAALVAQARRLYTQDEQFRGLYIAEDEVDALLDNPLGRPRWCQDDERIKYIQTKLDHYAQQITIRKAESLRRGIDLRLSNIQQFFELDPFEIDALLICLAVELDLRYERLYAYLQDDVTKKRPSVDLVLNLLRRSAEDKIAVRRYFTGQAPLLRYQLLEPVEDPSQPRQSLLATFLAVDKRITSYLLGSDQPDDGIQSYLQGCVARKQIDPLLVDQKTRQQLVNYLQSCMASQTIMVHLRGPQGIGRQSTALMVCQDIGLGLLFADLSTFSCSGGDNCEEGFLRIQREAMLTQSAVYWNNFDHLLKPAQVDLRHKFMKCLANRPAVTFFGGTERWQPPSALQDGAYVRFKFNMPVDTDRQHLWQTALNSRLNVNIDVDLAALATKFKFTGGCILNAAATAHTIAIQRDPENPLITNDDLYEACRLHSNQKLATLARKISTLYQWNDIVLPADRMEQLRDICNHIKYRRQVYERWGFASKLALGKGLSVLFAGPSGTGKTMAAEIISGELGLELYKIDLSTVVSKYIGETEKNLSHIFSEAETSNAILLFDEADALFGKRSEVKDSHDRYANIEVGYLLQRMEEYEGIVILATNLRKNMDDAFVRRLHFTVEFPFPDQNDRRRIWEYIWPERTPRDMELDLDYMARRFELTGGNIRNIAVAAAFFAAADGGQINLDHLIRATKREYRKMGKIMAQGDFETIHHKPIN